MTLVDAALATSLIALVVAGLALTMACRAIAEADRALEALLETRATPYRPNDIGMMKQPEDKRP